MWSTKEEGNERELEGKCMAANKDDEVEMVHGTPDEGEVPCGKGLMSTTTPEAQQVVGALTEDQVFARKGLRRTPPSQGIQQRCRADSLPDISPGLVGRPNKRRALSSPESDRQGNCLVSREILDRIKQKVEKLVQFGRENRNVRKEVKVAAGELYGLVARALRSSIRPEAEHGDSVGDDEMRELEDLRLENQRLSDAVEGARAFERVKRDCEIEALRAENSALKQELQEALARIDVLDTRASKPTNGESGECREIEKAIDEVHDYDGCWTLVEKQWPEKVHMRTKEERRNPPPSAIDGDLAALIDARGGEQTELPRGLLSRQPEIRNIVKGKKPAPGKVVYLESNSILIDEDAEEGRTIGAYTFLVGVDTQEDEERDRKERFLSAYQALERLRTIATQKDRERIHVGFINVEAKNRDVLRKMLECIFRKAKTEVTVYMGPAGKQLGQGGQTTPQKNWKTQGRGGRPSEGTVIVKAEGKSYADLLRAVKGEFEKTKPQVEVKNVRRSRAGDLVLSIRGGQEKANELKEAIAKGLGGTNVVARGHSPSKVVHVMGLDAITTENEIREAIRSSLGAKEGEISVKSIRPAHGEGQNATVELTDELANRLIADGRVKIGWLNCRIKERIRVVRCYRCQEFGHIAAQCKGEDRGQQCFRCRRTGHMAKECTAGAADMCHDCHEAGHRSGSMRCPKFRDLVRTERAKGRARRNTPT